MKRITDEQAQKIWECIWNADSPSDGYDGKAKRRAVGVAAYEACRPLILAEALAEPTDQERLACWWINEPGWHGDWARSSRELFANRLRALTKKPDAAVEAALDAAIAVGWVFDDKRGPKVLAEMAKIVAAVRAADKESQ